MSKPPAKLNFAGGFLYIRNCGL